MRRPRTAIPIAALIAVLAAACAPGPSPAVSASPSTEPPMPAPSAAQAPAPSSGAVELPGGSGPLTPGTYTRAGFKPRVTFEVGEGWYPGTPNDGFFDVQRDKGSPDVIAVQFGRVSGLVGADGTTVVVSTAEAAEAAAQTIADNPGLHVLAQSGSQLGGLTGFNLEVENTSGSHTPILDVPVGRLGIDSGRRLWISLVDTPDGLLAVIVGGSVAQWNRALDAAEPVLESIVIGEPAS